MPSISANTRLRSYSLFVLWGLLYGLVAFVVYAWLLRFTWGGVSQFFTFVAAGGITSAVVFALLIRRPMWLRAIGFLIVGLIYPFFLFILGAMLDQNLRIPDPLTVVFEIVWTAFLVPFIILTAIIYIIRHTSTKS